MRIASGVKYAGITRGDFLTGQIFQMNPVLLVVWFPGLLYLLLDKRGRVFRMGGIIWVTVFLILLASGYSKAEYLVSAYPPLLAAGSCWLERTSRRPRLRWVGPVSLSLILSSGIVMAPLAMPTLPVGTYIRYVRFLGVKPGNWESKKLAELPPFFADMFGLKEMARTVSAVYSSLPETDRKQCLVIVCDYGQAGAIEYYGRSYPVPPVVSRHNSYWYWGRETVQKEHRILIVIDGRIENHERVYADVSQATVHRAEYVMPYENNIPIFVCKRPKRPLAKMWDDMKHFD